MTSARLFPCGRDFLAFAALMILIALPDRVAGADVAAQRPPSRIQAWFWEVEGGKNSLWILGSIHCGKSELFPLPDTVERALAGAETIALENASATYTESENARIAPLLVPAGGARLDQVVSPVTYAAVRQACTRFAIPEESMSGYRPLVVGMILGMRVATGDGLDFQYGVDGYVFGRRNGRDVIRLEDFDVAIQRMREMTPHLEEMCLVAALDEMTPGRAQSLYEAYRTGASEEMNRILVGFAANVPEPDRGALRKLTIDDRNSHMATELRKVLAGDKSCFAVIGLAHLLGEKSVLAHLVKDGYRVRLTIP